MNSDLVKEEIWLDPETEELSIWAFCPIFLPMGRVRYAVDFEDGEFWVEGHPKAYGLIYVGDL
jgi:hypothetical protein